MNEVNRNRYYLDTHEDNWPPAPPVENDHANQELFLSYLALYHPFLLEPGYLRRVNSVDVLFQDSYNSESSEDTPSSDNDYNSGEEAPGNYPPSARRRKRLSQVSLARSLSTGSLASPGLSIAGGMLCPSPTASSTFLPRRFSRSASRGAAPPAESPTKRAFTSHSPIHEHVDYAESHQDNASIAIVSKDTNRRRGNTLPRPHPPALLQPHTPPLSRPRTPIHVPSSQNSPIPPLSQTPSSYEGQSSGDNYDSLYDGGSAGQTRSSVLRSKPVNRTGKTRQTGNGVSNSSNSRNSTVTDQRSLPVTNTWVFPVAIVTIGAVALIAGYYYMKRRS